MTDEKKQLTPDEAKSTLGKFIHGVIREGFDTKDEILERAVDYLSDEIEPADAETWSTQILNEKWAAYEEEKRNWPAVTDCDRLDAAFAELEKNGFVARSNFTCCSTCGESEIGGEMDQAEKIRGKIRGYTFFHQQDTEHAVDGHGLMLKYGPRPLSEDAVVRVGHENADTVKKHGLTVKWNGSADKCIFVELDWKKRLA